MVIETRYRDIDFDEARKCQPSADEAYRPKWEAVRGRPLKIIVPAAEKPSLAICTGPFFRVVDGFHPLQLTCPHLAEIGD